MLPPIDKTNWKSVVTFYILACAWSWPFFWWRDIHSDSWKALSVPNFIKTWSYMWGPGIAALICFLVFKSHSKQVKFVGSSLRASLTFFCILPAMLATFNQSFEFLLMGVLGFISIMGEELGWRGFLQDALKIPSDLFKSIIVGVMWELWHFTNRTHHKTPIQAVKIVLIWIVVTSVLSFVAIKLTRRTNSLIVAVTWHAAINAAFEFPMGWQAVLACIPIWVMLLWRWPKTLTFQ